MAQDVIGKLRRAARKPPAHVARRLMQEAVRASDRWLAPARAQAFTDRRVAQMLGFPDLAAAWTAVQARPFPFLAPLDGRALEAVAPGEPARIAEAALAALGHEVDLLGSGPVRLGRVIDWHTDFKTGRSWPPAYCHAIDYANLDDPSDVKTPWELSRLQWLIPAGQAFVLTGEERHAEAVREVLQQWMAANPYAGSVNWSCTMEAALRIVSIGWLVRACGPSRAFADLGFRADLLRALVQHADFTDRYIERSDVNGNHYTADAAGLAFAGLLLGDGPAPRRWLETGWRILAEEVERQVFPDGVDYEASVPYHRLAAELFLLPALYGLACGRALPPAWRSRLIAMARFTAAYSRQDGQVPLWGDNDDARLLPMAGKALHDHRYLIAWTGLGLGAPDLLADFDGPVAEVAWFMGERAALDLRGARRRPRRSQAFPHGGFYVLADQRSHVFADCGPLGLAGRGGHGHNDLLSFEAALDGCLLVVDPGSLVYTASPAERNLFRSTASHNTPQVAGEEINRFVRPDDLWSLHCDARPDVRRWRPGTERSELVMSHTGYERLDPPVRPVRRIELDHREHRLLLEDKFEGGGLPVAIPLHLAAGVDVRAGSGESSVLLTAGGRRFVLDWMGEGGWTMKAEAARWAASYGVAVPIRRLVWRCPSTAGATLRVRIQPAPA